MILTEIEPPSDSDNEAGGTWRSSRLNLYFCAPPEAVLSMTASSSRASRLPQHEGEQDKEADDSVGELLNQSRTTDFTAGCSDSSTMSDNNTNADKKVSFSTIQIREYTRQIGDNPTCSSGVPLSIDWDYELGLQESVDAYDTSREGNRRQREEMVLPPAVRSKMLVNSGISLRQIRQVQREFAVERRKRKRPGITETKNNRHLQWRYRVDFAVETIWRGIKRLSTCNKHEKDQLEWPSLDAQIEYANPQLKGILKNQMTDSVRCMNEQQKKKPHNIRPLFQKTVEDSVMDLLANNNKHQSKQQRESTKDLSQDLSITEEQTGSETHHDLVMERLSI